MYDNQYIEPISNYIVSLSYISAPLFLFITSIYHQYPPSLSIILPIRTELSCCFNVFSNSDDDDKTLSTVFTSNLS